MYLLFVNDVYSRHVSGLANEFKLMFKAHTNKTLVRTCEYQRHQNRRLVDSHFLYNKEELVIGKIIHISYFVTTFIRVIKQGCSTRDQLALECWVTENRHDGAKKMKPLFTVV